MNIKSSQTLVEEAKKSIETLSPVEAQKIVSKTVEKSFFATFWHECAHLWSQSLAFAF